MRKRFRARFNLAGWFVVVLVTLLRGVGGATVRSRGLRRRAVCGVSCARERPVVRDARRRARDDARELHGGSRPRDRNRRAARPRDRQLADADERHVRRDRVPEADPGRRAYTGRDPVLRPRYADAAIRDRLRRRLADPRQHDVRRSRRRPPAARRCEDIRSDACCHVRSRHAARRASEHRHRDPSECVDRAGRLRDCGVRDRNRRARRVHARTAGRVPDSRAVRGGRPDGHCRLRDQRGDSHPQAPCSCSGSAKSGRAARSGARPRRSRCGAAPRRGGLRRCARALGGMGPEQGIDSRSAGEPVLETAWNVWPTTDFLDRRGRESRTAGRRVRHRGRHGHRARACDGIVAPDTTCARAPGRVRASDACDCDRARGHRRARPRYGDADRCHRRSRSAFPCSSTRSKACEPFRPSSATRPRCSMSGQSREPSASTFQQRSLRSRPVFASRSRSGSSQW